MDASTKELAFTIIAITCILVLLGVITIALLLIGRFRQLKHRNEVLKMNADFQKEITRAQVEIIESTLDEVASQLHDDVGQMIALSIVQLNNIQVNDPNLRNEILVIRDSVQNTMQSVREISKTLSSEYIQSFGLVESMEKLVKKVQAHSQLKVHCNFNRKIAFHTHSNELFCFRIIQELLTNTIKHSKASEVHVSIEESANKIILNYSDNGIGLQGKSIKDLSSSSSLGFTQILKRVNLMKGTIELKDSDGFGIQLEFINT